MAATAKKVSVRKNSIVSIIFGTDKNGKKHAAKFPDGTDINITKNVAKAMKMKTFFLTGHEFLNFGFDLPTAKLFETGKALVPFTNSEKFGKIEKFCSSGNKKNQKSEKKQSEKADKETKQEESKPAKVIKYNREGYFHGRGRAKQTPKFARKNSKFNAKDFAKLLRKVQKRATLELLEKMALDAKGNLFGDKRLAGEYFLKNWKWANTFLYDVEKHGVMPSKEFANFIEAEAYNKKTKNDLTRLMKRMPKRETSEKSEQKVVDIRYHKIMKIVEKATGKNSSKVRAFDKIKAIIEK